jgi:hypothetical protein
MDNLPLGQEIAGLEEDQTLRDAQGYEAAQQTEAQNAAPMPQLTQPQQPPPPSPQQQVAQAQLNMPWTPADNARLQELNDALGKALGDENLSDEDRLSAQQVIGRQMAPLLARQQANATRLQQAQLKQAVAGAAQQQAVQQAGLAQRAKGFPQTVATYTDPVSGERGHFFYNGKEWKEITFERDRANKEANTERAKALGEFAEPFTQTLSSGSRTTFRPDPTSPTGWRSQGTGFAHVPPGMRPGDTWSPATAPPQYGTPGAPPEMGGMGLANPLADAVGIRQPQPTGPLPKGAIDPSVIGELRRAAVAQNPGPDRRAYPRGPLGDRAFLSDQQHWQRGIEGVVQRQISAILQDRHDQELAQRQAFNEQQRQRKQDAIGARAQQAENKQKTADKLEALAKEIRGEHAAKYKGQKDSEGNAVQPPELSDEQAYDLAYKRLQTRRKYVALAHGETPTPTDAEKKAAAQRQELVNDPVFARLHQRLDALEKRAPAAPAAAPTRRQTRVPADWRARSYMQGQIIYPPDSQGGGLFIAGKDGKPIAYLPGEVREAYKARATRVAWE